jgi:hypothetical protein
MDIYTKLIIFWKTDLYAGNVQIKNVNLLNRVNPTYVIKDCILVVLLQVTS